MIFIGPDLSNPHAHFVTNVVDTLGTKNDLIIDLLKTESTETLQYKIAQHLKYNEEKYVIYNAYEDEDFFLSFKRSFPHLRLVSFFSDDEWRHDGFDRYLALYSDIFTIAVKSNIARYKSYGLEPHYLPWACNPKKYHPLADQPKDIDVSFIGAAYGLRVKYIRYLIRKGITVKVYGKNWDRFSDIRPFWGGFISNKEMNRVISRSKINLNFLWTSVDKDRCAVKGRVLELAACCSFQIANNATELHDYGFLDDANIATFSDEQDLVNKINYYLASETDRQRIAQKAYEHVLENHTWQQRFNQIFGGTPVSHKLNAAQFVKYHVIVVLTDGTQHQIEDDERLDLEFIYEGDDWAQRANCADGVVFLSNDSSINNETIFMMAFGLRADQSAMIVANFYVNSGDDYEWVRFGDRLISSEPKYLKMLPRECFMYSADCAIKHRGQLPTELATVSASCVEYPSFWISLPYFRARKLRFHFAHHRQAREKLKAFLLNLQWGKALALLIDITWQRKLRRKFKYHDGSNER